VESIDRPAGGGQRRQQAGEHSLMVATGVRHRQRRLEHPHRVGRLTDVQQLLTDDRQHGERASLKTRAFDERFRRQKPLCITSPSSSSLAADVAGSIT